MKLKEKTMPLIGFILALIFFNLGIMSAGGHPLLLVTLPCFILVALPPIALMILNGYWKYFAMGFKKMFKSSIQLSDAEIIKCISVFDFLVKTTIKSIIVAVFIGSVLIMVNLLPMASMGPGVTIVLISPLYGIVFSYFLYYPIKHKLEFIRIGKD